MRTLRRLVVFIALVAALCVGPVLLPLTPAQHGAWLDPFLWDHFNLGAYRYSILKSSQCSTTTVGPTELTHDTTLGTSVTTANAYVMFTGQDVNAGGTDPRYSDLSVALLSSTTVRATVRFEDGSTGSKTIGWCVVEMQPGYLVSNQDFTVTIANTATTGTATLGSAVVVAKTFLSFRGQQYGSTAGYNDSTRGYLTLTGVTTVTGTRLGSTDSLNLYGTAVEFK